MNAMKASYKKNRYYLIVGASGTIGAAVARGLADVNVTLGLHFRRNRDAVAGLCEELSPLGTLCLCLKSELDSEGACEDLVGDFYNRYGCIDGLAICHGEVGWNFWKDLTWDDWNSSFRQHCLVPYSLVKATISFMENAGGGRIAYLSSIAPKYAGSPRSVHYAAAKGALEVMMKGVAREISASGIALNGVRAGFVLTPQQTKERTPDQILKRIKKIPIGRGGKPEEVASVFRYLILDAPDFLTGEVIAVAGGD